MYCREKRLYLAECISLLTQILLTNSVSLSIISLFIHAFINMPSLVLTSSYLPTLIDSGVVWFPWSGPSNTCPVINWGMEKF